MKKGLFLILSIMFFCACAQKNATTNKQLVGNDRDDHGCIGSAGYTWSEVRKECVRLFEIGIATKSIGDDTQIVYIVLDKDSLQVELFFSNGEKSMVLDRGEDFVWGTNDDKTSKVQLESNEWSVRIDGEIKYKQSK